MNTQQVNNQLNKLLNKIFSLKDNNYMYLDKDEEDVIGEVLKRAENITDIIAFDEGGIYITQFKINGSNFYLIELTEDYETTILKNNDQSFYRKFIDAEGEVISKIEGLLNINGKKEIVGDVCSVNIGYPNTFDGFWKTEGVKMEEAVIDLHGYDVNVNYRKNGNYGFVEIPFQYYIKIIFYVLKSFFKRAF